MASWCANCSGATVSSDGTRSLSLTLALEVGEAARAEELHPGTHPGALTRWATDEDLWRAVMGDAPRSDFPDDGLQGVLLIRDLFECAWRESSSALPRP